MIIYNICKSYSRIQQPTKNKTRREPLLLAPFVYLAAKQSDKSAPSHLTKLSDVKPNDNVCQADLRLLSPSNTKAANRSRRLSPSKVSIQVSKQVLGQVSRVPLLTRYQS